MLVAVIVLVLVLVFVLPIVLVAVAVAHLTLAFCSDCCVFFACLGFVCVFFPFSLPKPLSPTSLC